MTIKKYIGIGIISSVLAFGIGLAKFGLTETPITNASIPWIVTCAVLGIVSAASFAIAIISAVSLHTKKSTIKRSTVSLSWIITGLITGLSLYNVIARHSDEALVGVYKLGSNLYFIPAIFIGGYLILSCIRAMNMGWVSAFSWYAVDPSADEREREIQYQATGITFTFLLILIITTFAFLAEISPLNQGAMLQLGVSIFWLAITIRGFIAWVLHRR